MTIFIKNPTVYLFDSETDYASVNNRLSGFLNNGCSAIAILNGMGEHLKVTPLPGTAVWNYSLKHSKNSEIKLSLTIARLNPGSSLKVSPKHIPSPGYIYFDDAEQPSLYLVSFGLGGGGPNWFGLQSESSKREGEIGGQMYTVYHYAV